MLLIPKDYEVAETKPSTISKAKETAILKKAREILTEPMDSDKLINQLQHFYVFGQEKDELKEGHKSEHYTRSQIKEIVDKLAEELRPEPITEELPKPE